MSEFRSWAPEVKVDGKWSRNQVRFATKEEAEQDAKDLYGRWTLTEGWRATPATEKPNYVIKDGERQPLEVTSDE